MYCINCASRLMARSFDAVVRLLRYTCKRPHPIQNLAQIPALAAAPIQNAAQKNQTCYTVGSESIRRVEGWPALLFDLSPAIL